MSRVIALVLLAAVAAPAQARMDRTPIEPAAAELDQQRLESGGATAKPRPDRRETQRAVRRGRAKNDNEAMLGAMTATKIGFADTAAPRRCGPKTGLTL